MKLDDIISSMDNNGIFDFPEEKEICETVKSMTIDYLKEVGVYKDDSIISMGQKSGPGNKWGFSSVDLGTDRICEVCYRDQSKYLLIVKHTYKTFKPFLPEDCQLCDNPSVPFRYGIVLNGPDEIALYKDYIRERIKQILDYGIHMNCCDKYEECKQLKTCVNANHSIIARCNYQDDARMYKGRSVIDFPDDYVVLDVETTGYDPNYDEIIEVAAIKYIDNQKVDTFSSLIQPKERNADGTFLDEFLVELGGITNEMLADAPSAEDVLPAFKEFLGDAILVGHNVNFDVNFLYDAYRDGFDCYLSNDFIDTMRLSRRLHPEIKHHRLCDVAERYGVNPENAHRALNDSETTAQCYEKIREEILDTYSSFDDFTAVIKRHYKNNNDSNYHRSIKELCSQNRTEEELENMDIDHSNPLFAKTFVFTGSLANMTRTEAMQAVLNCGGKCWNAVTKDTDYLVLGNNDYCKSIKEGKSNKQKKAEQLKLKGQDIEIISENVFYDLLNDI